MNFAASTAALLVFLVSVSGCINDTYNPARELQQAANGYCHEKLRPADAGDPARPAEPAADYIDYYGPCDGASNAEQVRKQKRFEQFRFGRDYMDEG